MKILLVIPLACALLILGCSKKNIQPPGQFTWTYDGTTYNAQSDTAYLSGVSFTPVILASRQSRLLRPPSPDIAMHISSFNTGSYTFAGAPGPNTFYFIDVLGFNHGGVSGTLNITSYTNNRLGGDFFVTLTNNKTIMGNFSDVPVIP